MIELYDTHAHLNSEAYIDKLERTILEAENQGVKFINVVGFDRETNERAHQIAIRFPHIYATAGLHPVDAHLFDETDFTLLEAYLRQEITVAVGECGLDYYWHKDTKAVQQEVFVRQIELAKKYQKPLVIHMRDSVQDTYDLLKANQDGRLTGVMHSYSGSVEMAKQFLNLGFHISLAGPVTFKNAVTPKEVAQIVPLDMLLIETDCPYLTPHPYRGKENQPAYVKYVAEVIADLRGISVEEVAKQTTENALRLFQIK